jgi:hypothetical protein
LIAVLAVIYGLKQIAQDRLSVDADFRNRGRLGSRLRVRPAPIEACGSG